MLKSLRSYSLKLTFTLCSFRANDVKVRTVFSWNLIEKVMKYCYSALSVLT